MVIRVVALCGLVVVTVGGMVAATLHPETWPQVVAFTAPTVTTLLVLVKIQDYHLLVNSRMDDLLRLTAKASRAEGALDAETEKRRQGGR